MAHTRIKICGITRPVDALVATQSGADAIGLVFYSGSTRAVSIAQAKKIVAVVPPFVSIVALFVNETAPAIKAVLQAVAVDVLQFHGDESAQFCAQFQRPFIKAIRVTPALDIATACGDFSTGRGILLDAWQEGVPGGTGKSFDWRRALVNLPLPLVLAGGLNADNVGTAMALLHPAAVDVSGGVERAPGIKDGDKIRQFIEAVRLADRL